MRPPSPYPGGGGLKIMGGENVGRPFRGTTNYVELNISRGLKIQ